MQEKSTRNKYLEVCLFSCSAILTFAHLRWGMGAQQAWLNLLMGALLGSFPLLFVTKLYGLHKSMIAYTLCLFLQLFFYGRGLLLLAYPLTAMLLCSLLASFGWLDSVVRLVCASVITSVPMGILVSVLEYVTKSRKGVDTLPDLIRPMAYCLPQFIISYFFIYILSSLFLSKGYITVRESAVRQEYRKGSLRTRAIAFFIGGFFLLTVVAAVAANALLPYFYELTGASRKGYGMAGNDAFVPALLLNNEVFFWNHAPVWDRQISWGAFDLALFLHMCLFLVPLVVLADWLMQRNVLTPVRVMAYGLDHYLELVKDDRSAAARYVRELAADTGDELEALQESIQKAVAEMESYDVYTKEHQQYWEERCAQRASDKAVTGVLQAVEDELRGPMDELCLLNTRFLQVSDQQMEFLAAQMQTVTETFSRYLAELTDAAALGAEKLVIEAYEYGLNEMLGEAVNAIVREMQLKNLEFEVSVDKNLPAGLYGDEMRTCQIIRNVMAYTIQCTREGHICLSVRGNIEEDLVCLHFEIDDTVTSLSDTDISKLVLVETALKGNDIHKTGISLYVAKCLLEMMGSKLHVASVCENGTVKKVLFYFDLWQKVTDMSPVGDVQIESAEAVSVESEPECLAVLPERIEERTEQIEEIPERPGLQMPENTKVQGLVSIKLRKPEDKELQVPERIELQVPESIGLQTPGRIELQAQENLDLQTPEHIELHAPRDIERQSLEDIEFQEPEYIKLQEPARAKPQNIERKQAADTSAEDTKAALGQLPEIEGLDWNVAWMHTQDKELMARAVVGFINMIPVHGKRLEDCYYRMPWKNATQEYYEQIRRMRRDAETVGIYILAGMAGTLEESAREGKLEIVWAMHGIFLKTWYSYDKKLRRMIDEIEEIEEIEEI